MHAKSDSYTLSCRSAALPYPAFAGAHAEPLYYQLSYMLLLIQHSRMKVFVFQVCVRPINLHLFKICMTARN